MIEHVWSVLCADSVIDESSGNISLFNVMESVTLPSDVQFPLNVGNPFVFISLWSQSEMDMPTKGKASVVVKKPSGDTVDIQVYNVDLTKHRRARSRIVFQGFHVEGAGRYIFKVTRLDDEDGGSEIVARVPLDILIEEIDDDAHLQQLPDIE